MGFPDELRSAEEMVLQVENEFLSGVDGVVDVLLKRLSSGPFSSDVETAKERMLNLDESRYVKWERWEQQYEFSGSHWKDEGYPSIDATTHLASNPDWYSKRTGTSNFVRDMMIHRTIVAPTLDGERRGTPTSLGNPANKWLLDFVALSSLRLSLKNHWEKLVRDIVNKRSQTSLRLVAERLGLTIHEIVDIANKIRDLDDRVVEHDVSDSSKDLLYYCRNPSPDITPLVDIDL